MEELKDGQLVPDKAGRILDFIIRYKLEHDGNAPSLQDISDGAGISKTVVKHHVGQMAKKGILRKNPGSLARHIEVEGGHWVPPGWWQWDQVEVEWAGPGERSRDLKVF